MTADPLYRLQFSLDTDLVLPLMKQFRLQKHRIQSTYNVIQQSERKGKEKKKISAAVSTLLIRGNEHSLMLRKA